MSLPEQDERTKAAIRAGVAWLRSVAVTGMRLERVPIEPVRFENHTAAFDNVVKLDDAAPPIWARFYSISDNRPLFCRRDGTRVETLAAVDLERRTGYAWYGSWPRKLIGREKVSGTIVVDWASCGCYPVRHGGWSHGKTTKGGRGEWHLSHAQLRQSARAVVSQDGGLRGL